jgi:hypothetical protein
MAHQNCVPFLLHACMKGATHKMTAVYVTVIICFAIGCVVGYKTYTRFASCMLKIQGKYSGGSWEYVEDITSLNGIPIRTPDKQHALQFTNKKAALSYSDVLKSHGVTNIKVVYPGLGYYLSRLGAIDGSPDDFQDLELFFILPTVTVGGVLSIIICTNFLGY